MSVAVAARTVRRDDVGVIFRVTIKEPDPADPTKLITKDVSGATVKQLVFEKPDPPGTVVTQTAVFTTDGTNGQIEYTSLGPDLDIVGRWFLQGFVDTPTGEFTSSRGFFDVEEKIE